MREAYAYYNGSFGKCEEVTIPLSDRSICFGDAVYDAAIVMKGDIVWESEHINRLTSNASALEIPTNFSQDELRDTLQNVVKMSKIESAFLYFQISRDSICRVHSAKECLKSNLLITVEKFTLADPETPLSLITFPDKRYGYCNIKTVNLLPSVLAASEADRRSCDEAVFIRDGIVTECSRSNVFILKDGVLKTHPKSNRILAGITRQKIISACKQLSIDVLETEFTKEELFDADEILISSTTKLCLGAKLIDGIPVGGRCPDLRRKIYGELHNNLVE